MVADPDRVALRPPLPALLRILPDLLLLLGVHADHRVPRGQVLLRRAADVPELGVPVRVPFPLDRLGVALQAEPLLVQQLVHRVRGDRMPGSRQLAGQVPGGLGSPPQRCHRIAPLVRLHQGQQRRDQPRIGVRQGLAAAALAAGPAQRLRPGLQLINAKGHRGLPDARGPGHQPDPAMTQRAGLGAQQKPPLPLIQVREDRPVLRRQHLLCYRHLAHTTSACQKSGSYGLFSDAYFHVHGRGIHIV